MRRLLWIAAFLLPLLWIAAGAVLGEATLRGSRSPVAAATTKSMLSDDPERGREVEILAADGIRLRGSFLEPLSPPRGCVLLLHGVSDSRISSLGLARMFVAAGYAALAIDSRGHGASQGDLITYGLLERDDVLRWAAWLAARGCSAVYGLGESMGAAILIQAAAERPAFAAIVAECPFRDLRTIARDRIVQLAPGPLWMRRTLARLTIPAGFLYARMRYGFDLDQVSPRDAAARLETPLLLIHGTADSNIAPSHSHSIAAAARRTSLWLVPGAAHTAASTHAPREFQAKVLDWFRDHSPQPSRSPT